MKLTKFLIIPILVLAILVRFYNIGSLPSLNPDEAALGYNGYSLLETGKDEHGASWPLHFESFGDYKPGGYVYLDLPVIKIFGLTPFAVRLPNLIFSVLTILILYQLIYLLTLNFGLSALSAFILTISPWHIHFSRGAWEASTALFFLMLAVYWFFIYIQKHKNKYLILFPIPLAFSLYIYHSVRIVAPALFLIFFIVYFKQLTSKIKYLIIALTIGILISIPVTYSFIRNGGAARFGGVGLTADKGPVNRAEELLNQHGNTKLINRVIHNKRLLYLIDWGEKYTSHFDLNFLYLTGDDVPRSKSPDIGQLYLFELPFTLAGVYFLLRSKNKPLRTFTFALLFTSPLASSLTFQAPSALRALPMVIPLTVFTSFGVYYSFQLITGFKYLKLSILILLYTFSFLFYLDAYFVHAPKRYPFAWNTGFKEIVPYVNSQKANFQNIYFTNKYDQPYILYLFFSQYPPLPAQAQTKLTPPDQFGFSTVTQIDNIHFGAIDWNSIPAHSLVIAADEPILSSPIGVYNFPNGTPGFKIYIK